MHLDLFLKPDICHCTAYLVARALADTSDNSRTEVSIESGAEVLKIMIRSVLRLPPNTLMW
jgi:hypothetical protein